MNASNFTDPKTLGRYQIQDRLGGGAMGVVYKAHDPVIDRPVAIKVVRADLLDHQDREEFLGRFRREAQAAGRCSHPNIVGVYDFFDDPERPFIAMEYVEGRELADLIGQRTVFDPREVMLIVLQVLSALGYAHQRQIVHRDIKPANVILLEGGHVKVADFGVARIGTVNATQLGTVLGTPSYMSPEQCMGQEVDHRSDLFSCGVLLYEMLTGERPFPGNTATEILYRLLNHKPRDIRELRANLPASLEAIVARALAKQPEARFQNAQIFADALEGAFGDAPAGGQVVPDQTVLMPTQMRPLRQREDLREGWDQEFLRRVEDMLSPTIGPIARVLVRQAAHDHHSVEDMAQALAPRLPNENDRMKFLRALQLGRETTAGARTTEQPGSSLRPTSLGLGSGGTPASPSGMTAVGTSFAPDEAALNAVETELAFHLGPIARVMVRRAAGQARSLSDMLRALASQIPKEADRESFLRRCSRLS